MAVSRIDRIGPKWRGRGAAGLLRAARVKLDMLGLEALRLRFGFDLWHARSPNSTRPYRRQIGDLITGLGPGSVVEVGCGLGGILAAVRAPSRSGYDRSSAVIRAARSLHGRSIRFRVGGFEEVTEKEIDVLIAVNWIHEFAPAQLEAWLAPILPRVRYLVVDRIISGTAGYDYSHDFAFLGDGATHVSVTSVSEPSREFLLWQLRGS